MFTGKLRAYFVFGTGLGLGLLVGVGMLIGSLVASNRPQQTSLPFSLEEMKLRAAATHGGDTMAMATGPIAHGMDGCFFLDYLTGDLRGIVLSPRTGSIGAQFMTNVVADLRVEKGKKPSFLMVTGNTQWANNGNWGGGKQPAECCIYVCDTNTGNFAVYALPFNFQAVQNYNVQADVFRKLAFGTARVVQQEP